MVNLLQPDLWTFNSPQGQSPHPYFVIFREENVEWGDRLILHNCKELASGWVERNGKIETVLADYTAGRIISKEPMHFGTYEMSCWLPKFRGSWPAWWFYPVDPPETLPVEPDMMEQFRKPGFWNRHKTTHTFHDQDGAPMICKSHWQWKPVDKMEMTFRWTWTPNYMIWWVNGNELMKISKADVTKFPVKPMNMIVNSGMSDWNVSEKLEPFIVTKLVKL